MTKLRKKPKFMAQHVAKELVMNGRLPQFENYGEHISRYGKGFSQMLNIATAVESRPVVQSPKPRLVHGVSLGLLMERENN